MEIRLKKQFIKSFDKLKLKERARVVAAINLLREDRHAVPLRLHRLNGTLRNSYSISAGGDLRIVFREENGFLVVVLLAVGSHNQVY